MSDERNESAIDGQEFACAQAHLTQILRDEHSTHADQQNSRPAKNKPDGGHKQKCEDFVGNGVVAKVAIRPWHFELQDVLAADQEDPGTQAARRMD